MEVSIHHDDSTFKWCMVFLYTLPVHLRVPLGSVSSLELCQCYVNTITGSHQILFFFRCHELKLQGLFKDHMNHCISVVPSNCTQCQEHCALIHCVYHSASTLHRIKKDISVQTPCLFCYLAWLSDINYITLVCCRGWVHSSCPLKLLTHAQSVIYQASPFRGGGGDLGTRLLNI